MCCLHAPRFSNGMQKEPQSSSWSKFLGCRCRAGINQACRTIRAVWLKMRHYCCRVHLEQRCHKSNFSKAKSQTRAFFFSPAHPLILLSALLVPAPCNFFSLTVSNFSFFLWLRLSELFSCFPHCMYSFGCPLLFPQTETVPFFQLKGSI